MKIKRYTIGFFMGLTFEYIVKSGGIDKVSIYPVILMVFCIVIAMIDCLKTNKDVQNITTRQDATSMHRKDT
jgi:hypothetical protein